MSDPVTNSEVEDVLSSIRRLVGGNKRASSDAGVEREPERFVLTPQLRVADHTDLELDTAGHVTETEGWYEFEEPPLITEALQHSISPQDVGEKGSLDEDDGADCATFEHHEPEADAGPKAEAEETPVQEAEEGANSDPLDMSEFQVAPEQEVVHTPPPKFSELTAKIAALETAIARTSDQWEPDGDDEDAYAGTHSPAMRWQENVELDGKGSPMGAIALPTAEVSHAEIDADEQVIDEEMLRDLVADIVRQELKGTLVAQIVREELQGDLGERITRNVRKLVRREIQRALTARELD